MQAHCECCTVGDGNSSNPLKQVLNAIEEKVECVTYDRVSKMHLHDFASRASAAQCSVLGASIQHGHCLSHADHSNDRIHDFLRCDSETTYSVVEGYV